MERLGRKTNANDGLTLGQLRYGLRDGNVRRILENLVSKGWVLKEARNRPKQSRYKLAEKGMKELEQVLGKTNRRKQSSGKVAQGIKDDYGGTDVDRDESVTTTLKRISKHLGEIKRQVTMLNENFEK